MEIKKDEIWNFIKKYRNIFDNIDTELKCNICKNVLIDAQQSECSCNFCRECLINYLKERDICNGQNCPAYKIVIGENVSDDTRKTAMIKKLKLKCPVENCEFEECLEKLIEHVKSCETAVCPFGMIGCNFDRIGKLNVEEHLFNSSIRHGKLIVDTAIKMEEKFAISEQTQINEVNNLKRKYNEIEEELNEFRRIKIEFVKLKKDHNELQAKIRNYEDENQAKETQMQEIISSIETKCDRNSLEVIKNEIKEEMSQINKPYFLWIIKDIKQKRNNAILDIDNNHVIYSDSFYTRKGGYKLRLQLYPNGCKNGLYSHISIFIQLLKSAYDEVLEWPFNEVVTVDLLNTETKESFASFPFSSKINCEKFKDVFDKPVNNHTRFFGRSMFVAWSDLLDSSKELIKDDKIYIKVDFNPTSALINLFKQSYNNKIS